VLNTQQLEQYQRDGYYVARGLFSAEEVSRYREHYMILRETSQYAGDFAGVAIQKPGQSPVDGEKPDPLQMYPRMIHMHRWDDLSLRWFLDVRIRDYLTALLGAEPFAVQTMLYFKPPGARGQAFHQDQFYLRVQPGTCMAAWLALDDCDEANGCIQVIAGSHTWNILCTVPADTTQSFTDITVPLPEGVTPVPIVMKAGDMLFFNGSLVHGSFPNTTADRFRRALIGHYIVGDARKVAEFYHPVLRMDGSVVQLDFSEQGSSCGVWVDYEGNPVIEMVAKGSAPQPDHE
jgi:ectoine hydroxylase-related dioxygenase (phytanoyl-CoA dioxygenase family)